VVCAPNPGGLLFGADLQGSRVICDRIQVVPVRRSLGRAPGCHDNARKYVMYFSFWVLLSNVDLRARAFIRRVFNTSGFSTR